MKIKLYKNQRWLVFVPAEYSQTGPLGGNANEYSVHDSFVQAVEYIRSKLRRNHEYKNSRDYRRLQGILKQALGKKR